MIRRTLIGIACPAACLALAGCGAASRSSALRVSHDAPTRRLTVAASTAARPVALTSSCERRGPTERQIDHRQWLSGFIVTEYYPVPERWFDGVLATAPGSAGRHRVDWLYSASGVSMEGDGVDLAGHHVHIANLGTVGWVNFGFTWPLKPPRSRAP